MTDQISKSLQAAIRNVYAQAHDVRAAELEKQYGHYGKQPEPEQQAAPEVEVPTEPVVDGMEETVDVDPDTVTGEQSESGEEPAPE